MTTETEPTVADEQPDPETMTIGVAFNEYFREPGEVKDEDKPKAFPEVQRFVRWLGEDQRVNQVIASEVARFSETYRSNASEDKKAQALHIKGFLNFLRKRGYTNDGLASHIRVRPRANTGQRPATRRRRQTEVQITQQGHDEMQEQLKFLQKETIRLAADIQKAAASGDVRENAPLEAAREEQGMVQANIRRIESTLKTAQVIDESERRASQEVQIGSFVTILKADSQRSMNCQIVSANEANPLVNKISDISPVGSALLGRKSGDEVKVKTPGGDQQYKITSIG